MLLKHQADVGARDKNWQTPLHIAANNNHMACARKMLLVLHISVFLSKF